MKASLQEAARRLFIPAALFNFAAGGALLLALPWMAGPMQIQQAPAVLPWLHMTAAAVILLGWGYWQAAVDPVRNRIVIVMGIIGKLAIVTIGVAHALAGNIGWAFVGLTGVDLMFAFLFIRFLRANTVLAEAT